MPPSCFSSTPYKGLFLLISVFILLEYLFTTSDNKASMFFNSTRTISQEKEPQSYTGPLSKIMLKTKSTNSTISNTTTDTNSIKNSTYSNFNYVVTLPPLLFTNSTTNLTNNSTTIFDLSTVSWEMENASKTNPTDLPPCPDVSQNLYGRVPIVVSPVPSVQELEKKFSWLKPGGSWSPDNCKVPKKLAIIIPFRCRGEHLLIFLQHMHPFLKRQQLDYTIFLIEQEGDGPFNRALLMNIGYVEALKFRHYNCFIFHDIDLLPEDDRNLYSCPEQPRHMSVAVDIFKYRLPYPAIFGGVSAISTEHFKLLNGFSNSFWGWGGEDDDMSNRIRYHHLYISRYPLHIARYTMLNHKKDKPSPSRYDVLREGKKLFDKDGLNSLKYDVVDSKEKHLYTWILVKVYPPR